MGMFPIWRMRTMKYRKRLTVRAETGILRISKFQVTARKQASRIDTVRDHIENAILFLEESFGEGQELIYFMTVLTANRHSSTYIARFGCDAYARFNQELLLFDAKDLLKQEIKAGQEIHI